jgi:hypothetical protein
MEDMAIVADMGLKVQHPKSSAFIGLLVVDVQTARLQGYNLPQVQLRCEDDKVRAGRALTPALASTSLNGLQCCKVCTLCSVLSR